jgi:hypothetical protein
MNYKPVTCNLNCECCLLNKKDLHCSDTDYPLSEGDPAYWDSTDESCYL